MLKAIGVIVCAISFTFVGFIYGERYSDRIVGLNKLISMVLMIKNEIMYKHAGIPESIRYCVDYFDNEYREFLVYILDELEMKQEKIADIWQNAATKYLENAGVNERDIAKFKDLGLKIGQTNMQIQIEILESYIERTSDEIIEIKETVNQKKRLARLSGVMFGMLMIIVFI